MMMCSKAKKEDLRTDEGYAEKNSFKYYALLLVSVANHRYTKNRLSKVLKRVFF